MTAPLDQASDLLDGKLQAKVHSVRAAAWITRSALEDVLASLVRLKGLEPGHASTRTLLGCVEVLYSDDTTSVGAQAQYAWDGLTRAAHHHAYELAPTHAEVQALVDIVKRLDRLATSCP
ncbi:MAG: hypothetical protein ACYC1E_10570 [Propionibacteriaceae bacterium]